MVERRWGFFSESGVPTLIPSIIVSWIRDEWDDLVVEFKNDPENHCTKT